MSDVSATSIVGSYSLLGLAGGITFSYITEKPICLPICLLFAAGCGMIRYNNLKINKSNPAPNNSYGSYALKALGLYVLGPAALLCGFLGVLAIAAKR